MFPEFNLKRCLVRSLLVALAVLIGELVPKFDLVMGVIGGTLTGPLVFILPPLFYAKIIRLERAYDLEVARLRRNHTTLHDDDGDDSTTAPEADGDGGDKGSAAAGRYGTFAARTRRGMAAQWQRQSTSGCCVRVRRACQLVCSDVALALSVIVFGLAATVASTYFSAKHVNSLREFWSPCISNISYSFAGW